MFKFWKIKSRKEADRKDSETLNEIKSNLLDKMELITCPFCKEIPGAPHGKLIPIGIFSNNTTLEDAKILITEAEKYQSELFTSHNCSEKMIITKLNEILDEVKDIKTSSHQS